MCTLSVCERAHVRTRATRTHAPRARARSQVFGKVMVCKSLDVAADVARRSGLTAVTLEGDTVHRKGTLTGGFLDERR